jgi:ribosomal protein L37AE/L43A
MSRLAFDPCAPIFIECPMCGAEQEDHDGFGVLFCPACKYCTHPSSDGDGNGNWVCGICGLVTPMEKDQP